MSVRQYGEAGVAARQCCVPVSHPPLHAAGPWRRSAPKTSHRRCAFSTNRWDTRTAEFDPQQTQAFPSAARPSGAIPARYGSWPRADRSRPLRRAGRARGAPPHRLPEAALTLLRSTPTRAGGVRDFQAKTALDLPFLAPGAARLVNCAALGARQGDRGRCSMSYALASLPNHVRPDYQLPRNAEAIRHAEPISRMPCHRGSPARANPSSTRSRASACNASDCAHQLTVKSGK